MDPTRGSIHCLLSIARTTRPCATIGANQPGRHRISGDRQIRRPHSRIVRGCAEPVSPRRSLQVLRGRSRAGLARLSTTLPVQGTVTACSQAGFALLRRRAALLGPLAKDALRPPRAATPHLDLPLRVITADTRSSSRLARRRMRTNPARELAVTAPWSRTVNRSPSHSVVL